jgi:hypothetical protein
MSSVSVHHDFGKALSLSLGSTLLFALDYSSAPKPYFHPVCTISGHQLTNFQPSDHYWHRGLWFAIKFVNGENYWEEGESGPQNTQRAVRPPSIESLADGGVRIIFDLEWTRHDGHVVMDERRVIEYRPHDESTYLLDHLSTITPREPVKLDRTPFTTWGGYSGLCFRGTRLWTESKVHLSDGTETDRPTGQPGNWGMLTGKLDGDRNLKASVAILDHPKNHRHPSPWYGANGLGIYLTPAPLFHEPLDLEAGEALTLNYRLVIAEKTLTHDEVNAQYDEFSKSF